MVCANPRGYFPDPTNSILVVLENIVVQVQSHFRGMGIIVVTGSRYLVILICDQAVENYWLVDNVRGWTTYVETMTWVARI